MQCFLLLTVALMLVMITQLSKLTDEVYTLAINTAAILSAIWGFAIAPGTVQFALELLAFGWLQVSDPKN